MILTEAKTIDIDLPNGVGCSAYSIECAVNSGLTFDFSNEIATQMQSVYIVGTKMYAAAFNRIIHQYSITNGDLNTATYDSITLNVSGDASFILSIYLSPDRTSFVHIGDGASDNGRQYDVSDPNDLSTGSLNSTHDFGTEDGTPQSIIFGDSGTKAYMCGGNNNTIYQYSGMTTPYTFDGSFAYDSVSLDVNSETADPLYVSFNDAGTKMIVSSNTTSFSYTLSIAWDLSTATYDQLSLNLIPLSSSGNSTGFFNDNGEKFYTINKSVFKAQQYRLTE